MPSIIWQQDKLKFRCKKVQSLTSRNAYNGLSTAKDFTSANRHCCDATLDVTNYEAPTIDQSINNMNSQSLLKGLLKGNFLYLTAIRSRLGGMKDTINNTLSSLTSLPSSVSH